MKTTISHFEITHMKIIERNPDIDLDKEEIPKGMELVPGKNLMHTARSRQVPFGVATQANWDRGYVRRETVGLIIRRHDLERFKAALAVRGSYQRKTRRVE
jgi:hypothetical protein